jgi:glycosyltransferase involved in cell wall biosynthesis
MNVPASQDSRPDLSICVTVKNRSRVIAEGHELELFPNCVRSIAISIPANLNCELVVADWQSDDWPLDEWIAEAAGRVPLKMLTLTGDFSRGRGRNAAANAAGSDRLFFLDADCLIGEAILRRGVEVLDNDQSYFPVLYSYSDPQHQGGWWRHGGYGNCVVSRDVFECAGRFPEYCYWGREDVDFFEKVAAVQPVVREEVEGFYHQWHPNDFEWKNRYGQPSPHEELKRNIARRLSAVAAEIAHTVSLDDPLILIDDAQLAGQLPGDLKVLPFPEREGKSWGLPADSASAIAELERLRGLGTAYIAFAWTTFWWFDHYAEFGRHLRERYREVVSNDRLLLFDLKR